METLRLFCRQVLCAVLCIIISSCSKESPKQDVPVEADTFSGGTGTEQDPYIIATPADLVALSDSIELANKSFKQLYYRQTRDIDMSRYDNFKPIGTSAALNFCGKYDGRNHSISNLRIIYTGTEARATALFGNCGPGTLLSNIVLENVTVESKSYYTASLVGYLFKGTVKNCSFTGSVFCTGALENVAYMGGIAGRSTNGVLENCTAAGNVTTTYQRVGGIVGYADGGITITGCRLANGCSLTGGSYVGGIIGHAKADASNTNTISNCVCEGGVNASGNCAAAIAGYMPEGNISGCVQSSSSSVMAKLYYAGGIIANANPSENYSVNIDKCAAYGDVTAQYEVGGIIGRAKPDAAGASVIVSNCARVGGTLRATGKNTSDYNIVGGIVAWNLGEGTCRVLNSFSRSVTIDGILSGLGGYSGIVGMDNVAIGSITNVYTDIVASDITHNGTVVTSSSINYHGAVIGRNMTNARTITCAFYDSSYRLGPTSSSSHNPVSCQGLTAAKMADGTLLDAINNGKSRAATDATGVTMLSWKADADGYPILDGIPADPAATGGKKLRISIIGDSISTFTGWHPNPYSSYYPNNNNCDVKSVNDTWWYALATRYMKSARIDMNISFASTTVTANQYGNDKEKWYGYDFCTRFIQCHGVGKPDIIIIHGGTNDFIHNYGEELAAGIAMRSATMPSESTMSGLYATADACTTLAKAEALGSGTFCEAYIKLVKMVKLRYPSAKVVCIVGDWLSEGLEKSILHIADHYGCKAVDFVQIAGRQNPESPITKFSGCHPDRNGMDYMARTIYEKHGAWMEN